MQKKYIPLTSIPDVESFVFSKKGEHLGIVYDSGQVIWIKIGPYTHAYNADKTFDESKFAVLETDRYRAIVDFPDKLRKSLTEERLSCYNGEYWVGDAVHLSNRNGTYRIAGIVQDRVIITCKKWQDEAYRGERRDSFIVTLRTNIKCLAGSPFSRVRF